MCGNGIVGWGLGVGIGGGVWVGCGSRNWWMGRSDCLVHGYQQCKKSTWQPKGMVL